MEQVITKTVPLVIARSEATKQSSKEIGVLCFGRDRTQNCQHAQIVKLLQEQDRFVIASHIGPDGDAIGSSFGLAMALGKLGKKATVLLEPYPEKYNIVPGREYLYCNTVPLEMDVFIALDCADTERLGFARPFFNKARTTICIDHHATNEGFADYNLIDPDASSTAEMVLGVIESLFEKFLLPEQPSLPAIPGLTRHPLSFGEDGGIPGQARDDGEPSHNFIDAHIATAIYTGIVTDTGGFKYASTNRSTMEAAVRLMETGIPFTDIYTEVMHRHSFEASKALGLALGASKLALGGRIVYTCVPKEMLQAAGADSAEMDNVVEYLMSTKGAEAALFLYERHQHVKNADSGADEEPSERDGQKKIKVSMRSRGLHVGNIAASLGGGGHRMAAGCTIVGTMEGVLERVLGILEREL